MASFVPDRTVVINLERRPDRLAQFRASWDAAGWTDVMGVPQVFAAVDGDEVDVTVEGLAYAAEAYGCWASHVAVLLAAAADGVESLAVFEDDAVLQPNSGPWLRAVLTDMPPDAVGLWLDASLLGGDNRMLRGGFGSSRLLRPPLRTHAYLMTASMIGQLVPLLRSMPGHIDMLYAYLARTLPLKGAVMAATPSLAVQSDATSDTLSGWRASFESDVQRSKRSRWLRSAPSRT